METLNSNRRKVYSVLVRAYECGERVRLFYGDIITGEDWLEEEFILGWVMFRNEREPYLFSRQNNSSGARIVLDTLVKITVNKRVVYEHPTYHTPKIDVFKNTLVANGTNVGASLVIKRGNKQVLLRSFTDVALANRYKDFLKGLRNTR